ncbi:hypothetical protein OSTOST_06076, partial [Ostertagia ostertagi]
MLVAEKANLVVTFSILFLSMYVSLAAIVGRQFFHPYSNSTFITESSLDEMVSSTFSIFFFWMLSVIVGRLVTSFKLPSIFGAMCVGMFITNVPQLASLIYLNEYWHYIIRKLCLVVIIIRWGLAINGTYLRENP